MSNHTLTVRPVNASDGPALCALFAREGCQCHCRWWHFDGDKNGWLDRLAHAPELNRDELRRAVARGDDQALGVVATDDALIVGWMKLAPAPSLSKLYLSRPYRGMPSLGGGRSDVFSVGCFLVDARYRRQGLSLALLQAGLDLARARGGSAVEAFPRRAEGLSPEERWTGSFDVFIAAGFQILEEYAQYPVLRCELSSSPASRR